MTLNYLKPILYFIPLAVIQLVVIPLITIDGIAPNLILVLLVLYTLYYGQIYGMITGFIFGFILDIISGGLIGAFMFSFTISSFIAGFFYNENKLDINTASYFLIIILFICGTVNSFLYSSVSNSNNDVSFLFLLIEEGMLPGIYTAVFGIPILIFNPKKGIE